MNNIDNIEISVTLEETNIILEALGQMPFMKVHQLIGKIQQQAEAQIKEEQKNSTPKETTLKPV